MAKQINGGRRPPRGREAPPRRSLTWFYIALPLVAVVGVAAIALSLRLGSQSLPEVGTVSPRPLTAPTGVTEEGFAFKGAEDAPVLVEEYADFQCPFCGTFATTVGPT